jgi:hypothetical protein
MFFRIPNTPGLMLREGAPIGVLAVALSWRGRAKGGRRKANALKALRSCAGAGHQFRLDGEDSRTSIQCLLLTQSGHQGAPPRFDYAARNSVRSALSPLQKLLFHLWIVLSLSLLHTVRRLLVAFANFLSVIVQHR